MTLYNKGLNLFFFFLVCEYIYSANSIQLKKFQHFKKL